MLKIRDYLFLAEIAIIILLDSTDKYGSSGLALDNRYLEAFFLVVQRTILNPHLQELCHDQDIKSMKKK